jgi:inosine-uridine nucleoside N-ribohydrolase
MTQPDQQAPASQPLPVVMDLDGGIDDYVALVFLLSQMYDPTCYAKTISAAAAAKKENSNNATSPSPQLVHIAVKAVTVVEADCFAEPCVDVCRRLLALYGAACSSDNN